MTDLVFFYGTLMSGFKRPGRDAHRSRSWSPWAAARFGPRSSTSASIPPRFPASDTRVWGEVHRMTDVDAVLTALDEIEGYRPSEPDASLYMRVETPVTFDDGRVADVWVYFYNAPLGRAQRIESGDYLEHLKVKMRAERSLVLALTAAAFGAARQAAAQAAADLDPRIVTLVGEVSRGPARRDAQEARELRHAQHAVVHRSARQGASAPRASGSSTS